MKERNEKFLNLHLKEMHELWFQYLNDKCSTKPKQSQDEYINRGREQY